ncbi:MAG: ATP-binding protein [Bacteroidota bacterium]
MPFSSKKNASTRYGLLVFLILTLFICAIFFYIKYSKVNDLTSDIKQLSELKEDYSLIDSCIVVLYKADNNSRLYAVTGKKEYIKQFANDINFVSSILNNIKSTTDSNENKEPKSLSNLVVQKRIRTQLYLKLRQLTDSLISVSTGIDTSNATFKINEAKELTYKQFKTLVTVDTIHTSQIAEDKKFLQKVGDLFRGKNKNKVADTSVKFVRTEIKLDTTLQSKNFNKLQLKNMNNYFRNLYAANNMLKKNEIAILKLNTRIITEIVSLLKRYKDKEISFVQTNKAEFKSNIEETFKSIDKIFVLSLILLSALVLAILYNLWKIFKNESDLIHYSQKASQYAISKSRFLANMSHEIRTPLNSVVGFSEQLTQSELTLQQSEQVNAIRSSSIMLLEVVNDILDFSKYETGKVSFDHISFVPIDAITDVFNSIKIQAINKNIELNKEMSIKSDLCFSGDPLRLKQVLMNLLSNAIKFTDEGSVTLKVEVSNLSKKQNLLKVEVVDTGIGIGNEDIDMIFDEFAQVYYSSTKIKQKGTGLGLAICKRIVEFQGGTIGVTSELGKGSVFSFEIPYEIDVDNLALKNEIKTNLEINGIEGARILLADDNKMNILLAQTVLKKYKIISDAAHDGVEAYELFKLNEYDLVLTDIQMPEMGGVELTRVIRANADREKAKIPILGVTANVLEEDRKKYIESGIDDLVLKPFSERDLIDKIATYLKKN